MNTVFVRPAQDNADSLRLIEQEPTEHLLERILSAPDAASLVPQLQPALLHRVIAHVGLDDCVELVSLVTPAQLSKIFDVDLWPAAPGRDEVFDAARFGLWIEVLAAGGIRAAAAKVAAMPADIVAAGLAQHARVIDAASVEEPAEGSRAIGGYRFLVSRPASWNAIHDLLVALHKSHTAAFHQLMGMVRALSNAGFEPDGLHQLLGPREQAMFDLADAREQRRDADGFVSPAQARAYLKMVRAGSPSENLVDREPAFLANVLMAGCAIQGRSFTAQEAAAAVHATCALGAQQGSRTLPEHGAKDPSVIAMFETGWRALHTEVCMFAVEELIVLLADLRCPDLALQSGLNTLRRELTKAWRAGEPWKAAESLEVMISFDLPIWAGLAGLVAECPVIHPGMAATINRSTQPVDASAYTFISDRAQIASVHEFMRALPERLRA